MGGIFGPFLAAGLLFRRTEGPGSSGQDPRRGTGGVSRLERRRWSDGIALSASWRVPGVRADRRQRYTMLLPWLAVRGGRDHPRASSRDGMRVGAVHPVRAYRDRGFESGFLQRGVWCEPHFLDQGGPLGFAPRASRRDRRLGLRAPAARRSGEATQQRRLQDGRFILPSNVVSRILLIRPEFVGPLRRSRRKDPKNI